MKKTIEESFLREFMNKENIWGKLDALYKLCSIAALVGILYLNSHFVRIETYNEEKMRTEAKFETINNTLTQISITLAAIGNQRLELADHEARLRFLENKVK